MRYSMQNFKWVSEKLTLLIFLVGMFKILKTILVFLTKKTKK